MHCEKVTGQDAAILFIGLYLLSAGSAGIKASLPAYGADQFDKDPQEAPLMSSFFNFLLFGVCIGGATGMTLLMWIQDNKGWDWGFGLSTAAMFIGIIIFTTGLPFYQIHVTRGTSAAIEIIQVFQQ